MEYARNFLTGYCIGTTAVYLVTGHFILAAITTSCGIALNLDRLKEATE